MQPGRNIEVFEIVRRQNPASHCKIEHHKVYVEFKVVAVANAIEDR